MLSRLKRRFVSDPELPAWLDDLEVTWCGDPVNRLVGAQFANYPAPGEAVVMAFPREGPRPIHMLAVAGPLRALWLADGDDGERPVVTADEVLEPRWDRATHRAHTVVEVRPDEDLPIVDDAEGRHLEAVV